MLTRHRPPYFSTRTHWSGIEKSLLKYSSQYYLSSPSWYERPKLYGGEVSTRSTQLSGRRENTSLSPQTIESTKHT